MKKGIMGIRTVIAISLSFVLTTAQAATNSWQNSTSWFWEDPPSWSVGAPSLNDNANFITNAASKTVTLDDSDTSSFQSTLTISNLTVAGSGNATNTLYLFNGGTTTPLRILNSLSITNGGVLQITNAFLRVDESNSIFQIAGTLQILNRARVQARTLALGSGAVLRFAVGSNSSPVAVSNNLTVAGTLNITDGGGLAANTYPLFTFGGTLTDNGLTLGTTPAGFICSISSNATQLGLTVGYQSIVASFSASPTNGASPLPVTFNATATTGLITNWFWDFGDNSTTNVLTNTVVHTYGPGTFSVTLIASGPGGSGSNTQVNLITVPGGFQTWQQQYFGCTSCSQAAGDADPDGDGMSNTNEFLAGFNPTNNAAYLHIISIVKVNSDVSITYLGANGNPPITSRTNVLEFTTGAPDGSYSNNFVSTGQINILSGGTGLGVVTNMVDTGGASGPSRFYRVRVLVP